MPIRRRRKRRGASTGETPVSTQYRNHVWAIDFQADHLEDGTGFRIASIIDQHTRVIPDDTVDESITGGDLVGVLERLSIAYDGDYRNSPVLLTEVPHLRVIPT